MGKQIIITKRQIGNKDHNKKVICINFALIKSKLSNLKLQFYNQIYLKSQSNIKNAVKILNE